MRAPENGWFGRNYEPTAFAKVHRILCPRFELSFCREVDNERRV